MPFKEKEFMLNFEIEYYYFQAQWQLMKGHVC